MPTVTLKISDDEKALWVESAQHAGVTLSEWIRQRCKAVRMTDVNVTVWPNPSDSGVKVEQSTVDPNASPFEMPVLLKDEKESRPARKECSHARNHRPGAFCKFCFKSY